MNAPNGFEERALAAARALIAEGAREVYLFGSAAEGRATNNSDLDLAVSGLPPERFFVAMAKAAHAAGMSIDLLDLDRDSPVVRVLRRHGVLRRVA